MEMIDAKYEDGLLNITILKRKEGKGSDQSDRSQIR